MANQRKPKTKNEPKYVYQLADGTRYEIDTNENNELVTILREMDRKDCLDDRYARDAKISLSNYQQGLCPENSLEFINSPIDIVPDDSYSPETIIFPKKKEITLRDQINSLIPQLINDQQELWFLTCESQKVIDIAKRLNTTPSGIQSRKAKLRKNIKKLYREKYGDVIK